MSLVKYLQSYSRCCKILNYRPSFQLLRPINQYVRYSECRPDPCKCSGADSSGSSKPPGLGSVTYKKYVEPPHEDHDHRNMRLNRPMSPHLTIYGPLLTAMTSIAQRITGTVVVVYSIILASSAFLPNGTSSLVAVLHWLNLSFFTAFILKFSIGYVFSFHYFNGLRFVLWNLNKKLAMKDVYQTAYAATAAAAVLSFLFALL